MAMFKALDALKLLRVSKQGEIEGLDSDQHGAAAYPEEVISTLTAGHAINRESLGTAAAMSSVGVATAK